MHSRTVVAVFMLLALPEAKAAQKVTQEQAAKRACLNGDPTKGVEILTDLFIATSNPIHIFNQGRCFEQNNRYADAIGRFREYLRKAVHASKADRTSAEKHIAECEALREKERADPNPTNLLAPPQPIPVETPTARVETATPAALPASGQMPAAVADRVDLTQSAPGQSTRDAEPGTSVFGRWWFWTAVGAVVAGGVAAGLLLTRSGGTRPFCPDCTTTSGVNAP
jgi:hypothetical protein